MSQLFDASVIGSMLGLAMLWLVVRPSTLLFSIARWIGPS